MRYLIFIFILISSLMADDLQELKDVAAKNNPALKAKFNEYMSAMEKVPQVSSLPDPQIAFGYFLSSVETRVGPQQAKLSLSQKFPWFGKLQSLEDHYSDLAKVKYNEFEALKRRIDHSLETVYYNYYLNRFKTDVYKDILTKYEYFYKVANNKYENGKTALSDLIELEVKIDGIKNEIRVLSLDTTKFQAEINKLLNRDTVINISAETEISSLEIDEINRDSLLYDNSDIKIVEAKIKAAESGIEAANIAGYPDIAVGLDFVFVGERQDMDVEDSGKDVLMPMLSVSIPIYRDKYDAAVRENEFASKRFAAERQNLINLINEETDTYYTDYLKAKANIDFYSSATKKTERALELKIDEYANDIAEIDRIIDLQDRLLRYKINLEKERIIKNITVSYINNVLRK